MVVCRNIYLNVCICPLHMCEHRGIPFKHVCTHACIPKPICTPLHTHVYPYAKLHICIQMASMVVLACLHTGPQSRVRRHSHVLLHTVYTVAQAPHCCQCSVIMNSQGDLWFPAPLDYLSCPLLTLPPPASMTGSSCSYNPNCLGFPPPGGPQIPD